jgi:hypothetical protein
MNIKESKEIEIVKQLCETLNSSRLNHLQIINIVSNFLFSVGASLSEGEPLESSEEILLQYSNKPTLGNALMAQALWMKETWANGPYEKDNEDGSTTDAVQDL